MSRKIEEKNVYVISKYAITPDLGSATRQYFIAKYLSKLGYNLTLISSRSSNIKKEIHFKKYFHKRELENISHILINGPKINLGFNFKRVLSWIIFEINLLRYFLFNCSKKPDIVIISSLSLLTICNGIFLKWKFKSKLIFEVRDIWPLTLIEIGKYSRYNPFIFFLSLIEKCAYNKSDIVVGTMPNLIEHIENVTNKKVICKHIPMGYDPEYYNVHTVEVELPLELKNNDFSKTFNIGYAGTIGKANLVEEIIEAAKILSRIRYIHFYIIGDGPVKERMIEKASGLKNITFLPSVEKRYVNAFLQRCNLLVHTINDKSIYRFGVSPNKWIDYMYSSRPILVCYNGFKSIINEANCGKFIEAHNPELFANEILKFSKKSSEELTKIGANGKKYLKENLSYEVLAKEYSKLF